MRSLKTVGLLCMLAMALAAAFAGTASAAVEFLKNITGNTFTATSGKGRLEDTATKLAIKCEKDTASGTVLSGTTIETTVDFEQCDVAGLAAKSLGDANDTTAPKLGLILLTLKGELCEIKAKEAGIFFTLPAGGVHIEIPALTELQVVTGSVIGVVTPVNTPSKTGTITITKANITKCGGKAAGLTLEQNANKKPLAAEEETTEAVTFAKETEVMA